MSDFGHALASQIPRLRRYARALTHDAGWADDLVQDTLERALGRRWLFRLNSNLTAWLFTMLYRLYLNDAAHRRRWSSIEGGKELPERPAPAADIGDQLDLQRALARLSEEHRAVIVLVGLEQLSYKEAAQVLDIPVGTLMSRLARGRQHLRALLAGEAVPVSDLHAAPTLTRIK